MTARMPESGSKLYTPRLLGLAASLYEIPFDSAALYKGQARSKTCGSSIDISLSLNADGTISKVGMAVKACAIGQASAAILAGGARGRSGKELLAVFREIEAWLQSTGSLPDWPEFDALEPALPHAGRHGALLIPWRAINDALSSPARPS